MNKRKIILGVYLGIGITPGFCDLNDLYTKYPLLAITQGNEKISAVRKAVYYEEFLADKFVNFFNVQNALDFLRGKLEEVGDKIGDILDDCVFPQLGATPILTQIIFDMRLFSGDRVPDLVASIARYSPQEIIEVSETLIEALKNVEFKSAGEGDDKIAAWGQSMVNELQDIAADIADIQYLESLVPRVEEILDILEVPPPQSLYDTLVALQESNNYMDDFISTTKNKICKLENWMSFLLRATRSF
jgi:hypothetical protein